MVVVRARWNVVLGVFILGLAGCAGQEGVGSGFVPREVPPPEADRGQLHVVVLDDSELPIAGAEVAVLDSEPRVSGMTDPGGLAILEDIEPGARVVAVGKLGYGTDQRQVDVVAGEITPVEFLLQPLAIPGVARHHTQVGQGYIACGGYFWVVTVANTNACAWDANHKPRFEFTAEGEGLKGVLQEVHWTRSSGLTAAKLLVYLWYKPICSPTCNPTKGFEETNAPSPVRQYSDLSNEMFEENPVPLASMTFPGGDGIEVVVVYQQRIEHVITAFYNQPGDWKNFTALPS